MIESNTTLDVYTSAARTASGNSGDQVNLHARGVEVVIDMTAVPTIQTVTFTIEGKDETSGKYYTLLASAAIVAVSTVVLRVFPGATAAANLSANLQLPRVWRVSTTHSAAGSFTYSVGANLLA
jgi:hypothetical protein